MNDPRPETHPPATPAIPARPATPGQQYPWPAPTGVAPAGYGGAPYPAVSGSPSNAYRGLTIAAFVMSVLSLLGVIAIVGFVAIGIMASASSPGSGGPITGQATVAAGQSLPGTDLANAVEHEIVASGAGDDVTLHCGDTPKVDQGVVTVCHGTIDGDEWAAVVYFEDTLGTYTLNLI